MSTETPTAYHARNDAETDGDVNWFRLFALAGLAMLTATWVTVLYKLTITLGGSAMLLTLVTGSIALAAVLSRLIRERTAALLTVGLLVVSYGTYILSTPNGLEILIQAWDKIIADSIALLTGLTVLRLKEAHLWVLGFAPAPAFLSWYLAFRRRYVWAAIVGGVAFLVLVLTGDATSVLGSQGWLQRGMLFGATLGGIAMVGFGELERRNGSIAQADVLVVLFTLMLIASAIQLPFTGTALRLVEGSPSTVEGSLTSSPGETQIQGSIKLSPEVRFTVTADDPHYWRVGVYDRFTGGGWTRTGGATAYTGQLDSPPGETESVSQLIRMHSRSRVMPAANQPVRVEGQVQDYTQVTAQGGLQPTVSFQPNDTFRVISEVPTADEDDLRSAGTDYPSEIEEVYLADNKQPDFSNAFEERTQSIVDEAGADNPYETAVAIEEYLESNKEYSLDVNRPSGNVAEAFLLEMDRGYCVYFATTMAMMLRAQGIPARYVVGYTPGQQVDENQWVVRGLDSHAWVEVYFPDQGWVRFDPTPGGPRTNTEIQRIEDARTSEENGQVDVDGSEDEPLTTTTAIPTNRRTANAVDANRTFRNPNIGLTTGGGGQSNITNPGTTPGVSDGGAPGGGNGGFSPEQQRFVAFGFVAMVGLVASAHRAGATQAVHRAAKIRWQGTQREPETDVERAVERLELLLERRYRERKPNESPQKYVERLSMSGVDRRADRVVEIHEKAVYGPGVSREEADEAVDLVDGIVRSSTPILRRIAS